MYRGNLGYIREIDPYGRLLVARGRIILGD